MIYDLIAEIMERTGRRWKIKGGVLDIAPDSEDVKIVLDEAAAVLYTRGDMDTFETGGIIVTKNPDGQLDVYVHVGQYT